MKNILLIHGAWGGAWEFQEFIETLGKRGHRVHAIDLPGHGQSVAPISKVTMEAYVRASLDKVMSLSLQDRMISAWEVETIFTLESGHFPMMSIPERFVEVLSEAVEGAVAHA